MLFGTVDPRAEHHFSVGLENRILLLILFSRLLLSTADCKSLLVRDQGEDPTSHLLPGGGLS